MSGIGYHFLVRKDGTIYQGRPEDTIGAHAKGANHDSIGICAEGDFMKEEMNPLQLNALIDLVSYIKINITFLALKDIKMLLLQIAQEPIFHFLQLFLQIILF